MKYLTRIFRLFIVLVFVTGWVALIPPEPSFAQVQILESDTITGPPGTIVHIEGTAFTPSQLPSTGANRTIMSYADVYFPDKSTLYTTTVVNTWGNISTCVEIGDYPAGEYRIWIHDRSGGTLAWQSVPFTIVPEMILSKSSGYIGDSIGITGRGFSQKAVVSLYLNNKHLYDIEADGNGCISSENFSIPENSRHDNIIKAVDWAGQKAEAGFIAHHQKVTVFPNTSPPGEEITIQGYGFNPDTEIRLSMFDTHSLIDIVSTQPTQIVTNHGGNFTALFTVPYCPANDYIVEASDNVSRAGATLTATSLGNFDRSIGFQGSTVTFNGTGFPANRFAVFSFDNIPMAESKTDDTGSINVSFSIPPCQPGEHFVSVTDGTITQRFCFTVLSKAQLSVNRNFARAGSEILLTGTGFFPGKVAIVSFDDTPVTEAAISNSENFSSRFTVPACTSGTHVISVTDGTNTISQNLDVQSTEIQFLPPKLITPDQYTVSGSEVILAWKNLNDLDGIKYTLQIAEDSSFNPDTMIVEKGNMAETEYIFNYAVNTSSNYGPVTFFWRVKSIGSSLTSEWSEARGFCIKPLGYTEEAGTAIEAKSSIFSYSVLAEAAALVMMLLFWLIRKKRRQNQLQVPQAEVST
ncbi:MAG: IPT/TIG domain-containing protein [Dehalococcoidales bacterium]|nr:IPT/TIG domain-containing protein [Dehalococcoidales bacterium]